MANTVIEGTVTKVNGHGFKIAEQDEYLNISKWAKPGEAEMPAVGQRVKITLDGSGFVRKIEQVKPAVQTQPAEQEPPRGALPSRETAITRMACLNTATAILSSGSRACEPKDVVALAGKLEAWVNR